MTTELSFHNTTGLSLPFLIRRFLKREIYYLPKDWIRLQYVLDVRY